MTTLLTPTTAPKINKVYRRLWRVNGVTAYLNLSAEGSELLTIGSDGSVSRHIIGGWCEDCAFGSECTWPECPKRFPSPGYWILPLLPVIKRVRTQRWMDCSEPYLALLKPSRIRYKT
jgi:hypothetical protein